MTQLEELKSYISRRTPTEIAILIDSVTDHRTMRLEELTDAEINLMMTVFKPKTIEQKADALVDEIKLRNMRSKILALAERTGIKEPGNFHTFNNWMMVSSVYKKQLTNYNIDELKQLYKQLRAVEQNNNASAERPLTKAWLRKADKNARWN